MDVAGSLTGPITSPPGVSLALDLEKVLATSRTLRIPWATAKPVCSTSMDVDKWQEGGCGVQSLAEIAPGGEGRRRRRQRGNCADFRSFGAGDPSRNRETGRAFPTWLLFAKKTAERNCTSNKGKVIKFSSQTSCVARRTYPDALGCRQR